MILAKRDKTIDLLKQQIQERKQMLTDKYKQLSDMSHQNEYLNGVLYDYHNYFEYIQIQKQQQIEQYEMIYQYLDKIIKQTNATNNEISSALREQDEILNKIDTIKGEIMEIMQSK
jgi:hypothetical protein